MPDSYALCTSQVTAPATVTAVSYDSECQPSTLSTRIPIAWAALMDDHIAEAPRVILIAPDQEAASSEDGSPPGDGSSGGLSRAGKIAIGVVVPVVAILLLSGALFLLLRRKKGLGALGKWFPWGKGPGDAPSNGAGSGDDGSAGKAELQGSPAAVVSGPQGVAFRKPELDPSQPGGNGANVGSSESRPGGSGAGAATPIPQHGASSTDTAAAVSQPGVSSTGAAAGASQLECEPARRLMSELDGQNQRVELP